MVPLWSAMASMEADGFTVGKSRKSTYQVQGDARCSHHHLTVRQDGVEGRCATSLTPGLPGLTAIVLLLLPPHPPTHPTRSPGYYVEDHSHNGTWLRRGASRWLLKGTRAKLQDGDIISLVASYRSGPSSYAPRRPQQPPFTHIERQPFLLYPVPAAHYTSPAPSRPLTRPLAGVHPTEKTAPPSPRTPPASSLVKAAA